MKTLTIKDESATGKILNELSLQFESEYISIKELIEARVREEVKKYERDINSYKNGLILPTNLKARLYKKTAPKIDLEEQIYVALDAFQKNGFFILIDNEQAESLDQMVLIDPSTQVSFIKLTALVGG